MSTKEQLRCAASTGTDNNCGDFLYPWDVVF